jgi:MFS family permease
MRTSSLDSVRGFDRAIYIVAGARLVNVFGSGLVYPFATIYFHLDVGIALSVVGFGLLANNVATALATMIGGYLADRRGRKPVMVASMSLSAITFAAYAVVVPIAARTGVSPGTAFVGVATASGLTLGLYAPAGQALTADLTSGAERDQAFSLLKLASNLGFGAGLVVGGLVYEVAHASVFVLDGVTSAVVAIALVVLLPRIREPHTDTPLGNAVGEWGRALTGNRVLALALINVGFAVMYAQMRTTIPIVAKEGLGLTAAQVGTLFVLNPLTIAVLQVPLVAAISAWRRTRGLAASAGFWAASMLAVWMIGPIAGVFAIALIGAHLVVRTVGEILHQPLVVSLMSDLGTETERGSLLSLLEVAKRIGFGLGSFLGGVFFDYGLQELLWPTLALGCVGLVGALFALEGDLSPAENGIITAD